MQNVAIGESAGSNVKSSYNIAIGTQAGYGINYASDNKVQNGYNVSIGYKANYQENAADIMYATALGNEANASNYAVAIGDGAKASGNNSLALGYSAQTSDAESMALGHNASAADGNVAIGNGSSAPAVSSLGTVKDGYVYQSTTSTDSSEASTTTLTELKSAFTYKPLASDSHYISVGTSTLTRRISNVADGVFASDAATVGQLNSLNELLQATDTKVGLNKDYFEQKFTDLNTTIDASKTHYFSISESSDNLSANKDNTGATSNMADAMAIGPNANANNVKSLAVGNNVYATGLRSIAIGTAPNPTKDSAGTTTTHNTSAEGENSIALGTSTTAQADNSVAIGTRAQTYTTDTISNTGVSSVAIGNLATTAGNQSVALGYDATVKYNYGTAIGAEALASGNDAVAIGKGSKAYSTDSTAIGQGNSIIGNNVYGLGSSNAVSGKWGAVTQSGISGYKNTVTSVSDQDTTNALTGVYMTGSRNTLNQNVKYNVMQDITVQGSSNTIDGGAGGTSGHPNTLSQIAILGSSNTVQGKSSDDGKTNNIKDVTILGYNNKVSADTDTTVNFSDTQILGSNVTAKLGNSVYLGSNAAYTGQTRASSDAITSAKTAADTAAEASDAYKAATTDAEKAQIKAQYEAQYLYQLNVQAMEASGTTAGTQSYSTDETYGDGTSYTYAGSSPAGVVTVGSVGAERRIQNVAAGLVSATSTDAVNGSQLYALTRQLRFGGDNSSFGTTTADDNNVVARGSNETLAIIGGADTSTLTDNNIGVISDGKDTLTVKLNKNVDLGTDGSVVAGNTTLSNNGLMIADGPKLTSSGISAGSQQINNVTAGTSDTDAVNYGQMKNARTLLTKGTNTTLVDSVNGDQHTYTVNVDDLAVKVNGSQKSFHLKDGLAFGNGTNTTATMSDDGTITYNISDATIKTRAKDAINLTAGSNVTVDTTTSADGTTKTFTVNATHNKLASATATTGNQDNVTLTLKDADGNEVTSTGLKNTYSTGGSVTYDAHGEGTATVTRNDGKTYTITGLKDTKVTSGTASYGGTQGNAGGTATLIMNDGTTATISDLKDDYITSAAVGTENNHVTMTRLGGDTVDLDLNPILGKYSLSDYHLVGAGTTHDWAYVVDSNGTVTLNVVDDKNPDGAAKTIQITGLASQAGVNAGRTTVTSSDSSVTVSDSTANSDTHTYDIKVDYSKIPANLKVQYSGDNGTAGSNTMDRSTAFSGTAGQIVTTAADGKVSFQLAKNLTGIDSVTMGSSLLNSDGLTITGGPSVKAGGIDAGSKKITGVAEGTDDTDAVNVKQLNALTSRVDSASWTIEDGNNPDNAQTVKAGETVALEAGENLSLDQSGKTFTYRLNKVVTGLTSVTAVDDKQNTAVLNGEGLKVTDAQGNALTQHATEVRLHDANKAADDTTTDVVLNKQGLQNGGHTITGVADGKVVAGSQEAVNGGQLYALQQKVGSGWKITGNNTDSTTSIGADKTVSFVNGKNSTVTVSGSDSGATVKVDVDTAELAVKDNKAVATGSGVADAREVAEAINNAGWTVEKAGNAAQSQQVKAGSTVIFGSDGNLTLTQTGTAFTYGLASNVDISTIRLGGTQGTDGNWTSGIYIGKQIGGGANLNEGDYITGLDNTSWDLSKVVDNRAATEGQLKAAINQVTIASQSGGFGLRDEKGSTVSQMLGQTVGIIGDTEYDADEKTVKQQGNITTEADSTNAGAIKIRLNKDLDLTDQGSVTMGTTSLKSGQAKVGSVTVNGTDNTVSGLSNTTWDEATAKNDGYNNSTKAATESQLQAVYDQATTTASANEQHIQSGTYHIVTKTDENGEKQNSVTMKIVDGSGNEKGQVVINDVAKASDLGDTTRLAGDIQNRNGSTSVVDAVNNLNDKVGDNQYLAVTGKEIQDGDSSTTAIGKLNNRMNDIYSKATQHSTVTKADDNVTIQTSTNADGGTNYQIGLNKEKIDLGKVTIQGNEGSITAKSMTADTFMAGNTVVNNEGVKVGDKSALTGDLLKVNGKTYVDDKGINANGKAIGNVGDGKKDTDAVNVKQLNKQLNDVKSDYKAADAKLADAIQQTDAGLNEVGRAVDRLGNRLNRVGAGAAALAALHPGTYDSNDKWDFSAGIGHYHDANAVAIGAYYHPNDTTILSIGGSMGGGENMVNAGITWKMGRSGHEQRAAQPVVTHPVQAAPVVQQAAPARPAPVATPAPVVTPAPVTTPVPVKAVVPATPVPAVTTAMTAAPSGDTAALTQILARQTAILEKLAQNQSQAARPTAVAHGDDIFPDVPENHWAYAYVAKLEKAGALKGFKRPAVLKSPMMTRDDFASVLYTAMTNGATTNPALNGDDSLNRLAQEFKAELKDVKP